MKSVAEKNQEIEEQAQQALEDPKALAALMEGLQTSSRRERQNAATALAAVAKAKPELLADHANDFVDALNRPEAQTRWESLDVLSCLVELESRTCDKAIPGAETALFDEDNGFVRLAALRFLAKLGATTENRSEKVWPLLDEAIQCYHGDYEFPDMLNAINEFAGGKLSENVRAELIDRMTFDATNGKGSLKRRAQQIIDTAQK